MKQLLSLAFGLLFSLSSIAQVGLHPKQVAAQAQDLISGRLRLPDPQQHAARSLVHLEHWAPQDRSSSPRKLLLPEGSLRLGVLSSGPALLALVDGQGQGAASALSWSEPAPTRWAQRWTQGYELAYVAAGPWNIEVQTSPGEEAWLVVRDSQNLEAQAWVDTWQRTSDRTLPLRAKVTGAVHHTQRVTFVTSDGSEVELNDQGQAGDQQAGDGLFSADWPAGSVGRVQGHVRLQGESAAGPFQRTVPLVFEVEAATIRLVPACQTKVLDARRMAILLPASSSQVGERVQVSAELWGHDVHGNAAPACWLSRMQAPQLRAGKTDLQLVLDGRWLNQSKLRAPLELRNLRIQDPDSHVVLDRVARLPLPDSQLPPVVGQPAGTIDRAMLMGSFQSAGNLTAQAPLLPNPALFVLHGYCSSGTPWPGAAFSQPKRTFLDPSENRSHDEFAQEMLAQGAGLTSFGVVGHSQGGNAALHLYTYYQSPLDQAQGARLIQSVASPYQGTPLASLGFFACGVNDDLTPSGAAAWLAGIPSWARAEVSYWTVSDGGSACNFFTGLLLGNPEDGTVEVSRGQLPGAQNMGNQTGWCHTSGMSFPSCTTDGQRNAEIDVQAAR